MSAPSKRRSIYDELTIVIVGASRITDNQTASLNKEELSAYLEECMVEFPPPMAQWMANPIVNKTLGGKFVLWAISTYPNLAASTWS